MSSPPSALPNPPPLPDATSDRTALGAFSWALAQGARDPYYILVVIYIFYPYFSNTLVGDPVRGQSLLGYGTATAGLLLAVTAPLFGAIADKDGRRKPWIAGTVLFMGIGSTLLWWVLPGGEGLGVFATLALLILINFAFTTSEVFHNAMLPTVTLPGQLGRLSGLAFSIGNVGGLLLMLFVLFAFALPGQLAADFLPDQPLFGIDQTQSEHDRIVGPLAALWMLLFTAPLLAFAADGAPNPRPLKQTLKEGLADVADTFRALKHYQNIALYLLARMFFIDGMVGVLTFGGVYASGVFEWGTVSLLIFGLCTSAAAMVGALIGGRLDDHFGSRNTLLVAVAVSTLLLVTLVSVQSDRILFVIPVSTAPLFDWPYMSKPAELFYFATNMTFATFFVTGLASSRTLMARIVPESMATQFFGLFALSGTVTAFLAPLLVGTVTDLMQSQRAGFASLAFLMTIGGVILLWVREQRSADHRLLEREASPGGRA